MFLKSSNISDSSLFNARSSRIVIRLLSDPFVIILVLARKVVSDIVNISYFIINLIMSKMRPSSDIIFFSILILLILRS